MFDGILHSNDEPDRYLEALSPKERRYGKCVKIKICAFEKKNWKIDHVVFILEKTIIEEESKG